MAEAEEDIEETIDIKDIQVKDIEAAKDMEMQIWRMAMEMPKPSVPPATSPHVTQFSAVLHIVSKRR